MKIWELFIIAVGLSMDAFAIAICKGLSVEKVSKKQQLTIGLYFGGFQALMPLLGYLLGIRFQSLIAGVDHWIAFVLLAVIGINMIYQSFKEEKIGDSFAAKVMIPLALASSIDALAIGVTFAFLQADIVPAISFIGVMTFVISAIGLKLGHVFGAGYKKTAERLGGVVLVFMGVKILLEHLSII
ncbi:manganese efflux pump MntP [Scatolibacter rhodanostii]|uniref:manganese efflux pump MntP n=1 Tax=Scatolibacter rhodanostii TaxID=2014781 RepID=UPI000C08870B|nr:manganese efflux pump MntP family protein [Scatolibacter rhodanostii]